MFKVLVKIAVVLAILYFIAGLIIDASIFIAASDYLYYLYG